jgi:predicted RNase H-like nuclease
MVVYNSPQSVHLLWDSAPTATFVGIDGARGGWVVATCAGGNTSLQLYRAIADVPLSSPGRVLIDMPIGLPSQHRRLCDAQARELLGPRRATIFPVPTRAAVYTESYAECCAVNERIQGCRVSKQAWNLFPKIRELDLYLRADSTRHACIAEGHPELAFRALHASASPLPSKRTPEGIQLRRDALAGVGVAVDALIEPFLASHPKDVDVTDALDALALCALLTTTRGRVSFVGQTDLDEHGAPQRICVG